MNDAVSGLSRFPVIQDEQHIHITIDENTGHSQPKLLPPLHLPLIDENPPVARMRSYEQERAGPVRTGGISLRNHLRQMAGQARRPIRGKQFRSIGPSSGRSGRKRNRPNCIRKKPLGRAWEGRDKRAPPRETQPRNHPTL